MRVPNSGIVARWRRGGPPRRTANLLRGHQSRPPECGDRSFNNSRSESRTLQDSNLRLLVRSRSVAYKPRRGCWGKRLLPRGL